MNVPTTGREKKKRPHSTPNRLVYLLRALIFLLFLWRRLCLFFFHFHLICDPNMTQSELNLSNHPCSSILPPFTWQNQAQFQHKIGTHCRVDFPSLSKRFRYIINSTLLMLLKREPHASVLTRFLNRVLGNVMCIWISRLTQTYILKSKS